MSDDSDFMLAAFKGNASAVEFVQLLSFIADEWDNHEDRDAPADMNAALYTALVKMPRNAFYRSHMDDLIPLMATGIFNWWTANKIERTTHDENLLHIAHVTRYNIGDVVIFIAGMLGGKAWLEEVGPELRARIQRSDFSEYLHSLGGRDARL